MNVCFPDLPSDLTATGSCDNHSLLPARLLYLQLGQRRVFWKHGTSWRHQNKAQWCCSTPPGPQPGDKQRRTDWRNQKAGKAPGSHQMFPVRQREVETTHISEKAIMHTLTGVFITFAASIWPKMCVYQVCAHISLQSNLLCQRKRFILNKSSLLNFANHLFVASPLEPVGQEGLHDLIQNLTGDQQGGQALKGWERGKKMKYLSTEQQNQQTRTQRLEGIPTCLSSIMSCMIKAM